MEDYTTRAERLRKTKRKFIKSVMPLDIWIAFQRHCNERGLRYTEGLILAITSFIKK